MPKRGKCQNWIISAHTEKHRFQGLQQVQYKICSISEWRYLYGQAADEHRQVWAVQLWSWVLNAGRGQFKWMPQGYTGSHQWAGERNHKLLIQKLRLGFLLTWQNTQEILGVTHIIFKVMIFSCYSCYWYHYTMQDMDCEILLFLFSPQSLFIVCALVSLCTKIWLDNFSFKLSCTRPGFLKFKHYQHV